MDKMRRYNIEGTWIYIPIRYDEISKIYIEIYPDFKLEPAYTPKGYPIFFTGEDACGYAEATDEERCIDCGSCRFFRQSPFTLIGVCGNEKNRRYQQT